MQIIRPLIAGGFRNSMRDDQGYLSPGGKMAAAAVYVRLNGINVRSGDGGGAIMALLVISFRGD